jgi:hypothetical protein
MKVASDATQRKMTKRRFFKRALVFALAVASTCTQNGEVANAEQVEKGLPGIVETKDIAESGFIFGLPLVMNYAIMSAYSINRHSGAFTAPFNQILNEPRVYTYKDTAIPLPNSDTPYSVLFMDLRAEPIVLSLPAVERERYYVYDLVGSDLKGCFKSFDLLSSRRDASCRGSDLRSHSVEARRAKRIPENDHMDN